MIPYGLIARGIAVLAILAALAYAWHRFTEHYREQGREEVRLEWEKDKAERIAAADAMVEVWRGEVARAGKASRERDDERRKRRDEAARRAAELPPEVAGVAVPGAAVGVLNRALGDTAPATGSTGAPERPAAAAAAGADSTVGLLTGWGIEVIAMYETCRARVTEWREFYAALQAAQPRTDP